MRRDALPEHTDYEDDGCHISKHCLPDEDGNGGCPLARCIFDDPRGQHRDEIADLAPQMAAMLAAGSSPKQIADHFQVSKRTVWRYLKIEEQHGGVVVRRRQLLPA